MTVYRLPTEPAGPVWVEEQIYDPDTALTLVEVTRWIRTPTGWDDGDARELSWGQLLELGLVYDEAPLR
jgi:hypothetical protein